MFFDKRRRSEYNCKTDIGGTGEACMIRSIILILLILLLIIIIIAFIIIWTPGRLFP